MRLAEADPFDARPLLTEERTALLELLAALAPADWRRPTPCPGWDVRDICLHVLGEDLGRLSRGRDGDTTGLIDKAGEYRTFVTELNASNERWVAAARRLSPRMVRELLAFAGPLVDEYHAGLEMEAPASVAWAGPGPVPAWFEVARYFTERWVHQQQIRTAVGRPGLDGPGHLGPVLRTFVWALPHHYREVDAAPGTTLALELTGSGGGEWTLVRYAGGWELEPGIPAHPAGRVAVPAGDAWRLFTAALDDGSRVRRSGTPELTDPFLTARAIIV